MERAPAELAGRQHGVVALAQLKALGLGARAAQYRGVSGRLHRLHRGVYAVGHRVLSPDGHRMAAVLACADVHRTAKAFEDDRLRDAALAAENHVVVRFTSRRIDREPGTVLHELVRILALRSSLAA